MKKLLFLFLLSSLYLLYGCNDNEVIDTIVYKEDVVSYKVNEPVFISKDDFRKLVKVTKSDREITGHGKICFYNGYLYISQPEVGIHIIDNKKPTEPKKVGFIELLGNADLSIRNNLLYADSYMDLVWFDITNPESPILKGRLKDVFPFYPICTYPADNEYGYDYSEFSDNRKEEIIFQGWKVVEHMKPKKELEDKLDRNGKWIGNMDFLGPIRNFSVDGLIMFPEVDSNSGDLVNNGGSGGGNNTGKNGSMSRFSLYKDYMYVVLNSQMSIFDLRGEEPVKAVEDIFVDWDVETIFSYKNCMFLGTPRGMSIYSVENPLKPERQSTLWHVYGCDPVVVEDDIAYITVHSGNFCGQNNNELIIIDVSDVKSPKPIVSYAMTKPKGLGIDNGTLFVCDDGLKVFDAKKPQELMGNRLAHYSGMEGYDVIPFNNVLMMIAEDGLYQYDYSDVKAITQLSKLSISKK